MTAKQKYNTIEMLSSINKQKDLEAEVKRMQLLNYIEMMKRNKTNNLYQRPLRPIHETKRDPSSDEESESDHEKEVNKVKLLNQEELKKRKQEILTNETMKAQLMDSIGLPKDIESIIKANFNVKSEKVVNVHNKGRLDKNLIQKYIQISKRHVGLTPIQKFRGMAKVVTAFFILRKVARCNDKQKELFIKYDIMLHSHICENWLLKITKQIISSVSVYYLVLDYRTITRRST